MSTMGFALILRTKEFTEDYVHTHKKKICCLIEAKGKKCTRCQECKSERKDWQRYLGPLKRILNSSTQLFFL